MTGKEYLLELFSKPTDEIIQKILDTGELPPCPHCLCLQDREEICSQQGGSMEEVCAKCFKKALEEEI